MFTGFPQETDDFFLQLKFNNNRAYFEANRERFVHNVQAPLKALAEDLADALLQIDPQLDTRPSRAVSRIHRDMRFHKTGPPYREHMWIGYRRVGEARVDTCGFFFDISLDQSCWGCGFYQENRPAMDAVRRLIVAKPGEVLAVLEDGAYSSRYLMGGDTYKKALQPPDELPEPLHTLYMKKGVYAEHVLEDRRLLYGEALTKRLMEDFQALAPFYWLLRGRLSDKDRT